jgi:hypothetical protein
MQYYSTNSNFIKLNKIFKEAAMAASSSSSFNNYASKRPSPYSKPPSRNNRGNSNESKLFCKNYRNIFYCVVL